VGGGNLQQNITQGEMGRVNDKGGGGREKRLGLKRNYQKGDIVPGVKRARVAALKKKGGGKCRVKGQKVHS